MQNKTKNETIKSYKKKEKKTYALCIRKSSQKKIEIQVG